MADRVDIIYTDPYGYELGMLEWAEGEFAIGDENRFELKVPPGYGITQDCFLTADGREYGGIVDDVVIDTGADYATVEGRTWHGAWEKSIIEPDAGQDYLVYSGECNALLGKLIERLGLGYAFRASTASSGVLVNQYQFSRYVDGYNGARAMLRSVGMKMRFAYDGALRCCVVSAVPRGEYIDDGIDGDKVRMTIAKRRVVNHLVGLGSGELRDRVVVHRYADAAGNISDKQSLFGVEHKAEVYDSPSSDTADLIEGMEDRLREYQQELFTCSIPEDADDEYDIDDIVGGTSTDHNISVVTSVAKKIATIDRNRNLKVSTKTDTEV